MSKTAIEKLIESYEKRGQQVEHGLLNAKSDRDKDSWKADKVLNDMFLKDLRNSLPAEQSQIEETFNSGREMADTDFPGEHPFIHKWDNAEQYFTTTFKQQP